MKIETIGVWGFEGAIRGMRNAKKSHARMDSEFHPDIIIGDNDAYLMRRLIKGGPEHAKFARYIHVQADWEFPRYFWSEADTYKFMEKNSESTMHTLLKDEADFGISQFEYDPKDLDEMVTTINRLNELKKQYKTTESEKAKIELLIRAKKLLAGKVFCRSGRLILTIRSCGTCTSSEYWCRTD